MMKSMLMIVYFWDKVIIGFKCKNLKKKFKQD